MASHRHRSALANLTLMALVFLLIGSTITLTIEEMCVTTSETTMFVSPSTIAVNVSQTFEMDINVSEVSDLYGWEFKLSWNPSLLEVINIAENNLLGSGGETYLVSKLNNIEGYILVGCTLLRNIAGVNGNGTLATVEFQAENEGSCSLDLYDTKLVSSVKQLTVPTDFDSTVTILLHDIAVTSIEAYPKSVPQGQPININVTVENQGDAAETFDVIVYADQWGTDTHFDIGSETVSLGIGGSSLVEFVWDTIGVPCGTYWITAEAILPEDADPEDNIARTKVGGICVPYSPHSVNIISLLLPLVSAILVVALLGAAALGLFKILMSVKLPFRRDSFFCH